MRSEEARIGAKVMVGEAGLGSEWRGLAGTITGKWGNPEYLALDDHHLRADSRFF